MTNLALAAIPKGLAEWIRLGVVTVLVAVSSFTLGQCDGQKTERHAWERKIEQDKAAQAIRERQADFELQKERAGATDEARARQKEIDDATRNLPDQGLTARQRARACAELRRQAQAAGWDQPAC